MVFSYSFKTKQDRDDIINFLNGTLIIFDRNKRLRIKKKSENFIVEDIELFLKNENEMLKVVCDDEVDVKEEYIKDIHIIGHCGVVKTKQKSDKFYYNIKREDIANYIAKCP
ncbi:hypothetical protein A3Q56_03208 [Intoshia linei]|uniref:Integrase zinc-binding domain-containing protein n=1 Tax=Intoshia linei TaxID=1819745 RepID=A0A177B631_9BILA|nr:hypothetical protein A3Q56_03208 [Intoshia linei]